MMGISGEFSFLDVVNSATRGKTGVSTKDFTEIWLSPYEVKEALQNTHHECKNIDALADDFLLVGQHSPTILGRVNGEYRIVDGHRRNRANILLIESGHEQFKRVRYFYKDMTENMYELSLLSGNGFTQDLTPYEKTELAGRLKKVLEKIRDTGEIEIKGRIRDIIGKYLGETSGQMARIEKINNSLTEEAKEQFRAGNMGISAAYETARLPAEDQKIIAEKAAEPGGIEGKEIAAIVKEKKELEKQTRKAEEAAKQAKKAAKEAKEAHVGAAQASLHAERAAENADQSAGVIIGMNPPIVSESDTEENGEPSPEEIKQEAIFVLEKLLTMPGKIIYEEVLRLQEILIECNHRG
jgi:ParB family chromosome partitioning protein